MVTQKGWGPMYKACRFISVLGLAIFLGACASTSYFKEASSSELHAVLRFEKVKGVLGPLGGQQIVPLEINGQPPNQWNKWSFKEFLIPPGNIVILAKVNVSLAVTAYGYVKFFAEPGEIYEVTHTAEIEEVVIKVANSKAEVLSAVKAKKLPDRNQPNYMPIFIPAK